jgi:hypothetical protein
LYSADVAATRVRVEEHPACLSNSPGSTPPSTFARAPDAAVAADSPQRHLGAIRPTVGVFGWCLKLAGHEALEVDACGLRTDRQKGLFSTAELNYLKESASTAVASVAASGATPHGASVVPRLLSVTSDDVSAALLDGFLLAPPPNVGTMRGDASAPPPPPPLDVQLFSTSDTSLSHLGAGLTRTGRSLGIWDVRTAWRGGITSTGFEALMAADDAAVAASAASASGPATLLGPRSAANVDGHTHGTNHAADFGSAVMLIAATSLPGGAAAAQRLLAPIPAPSVFFSSLHTLCLREAKLDPGILVGIFSRAPRLEVVDVTSLRLGPSLVVLAANCPMLRDLHCGWATQAEPGYSGIFSALTVGCPRLECAVFSGMRVAAVQPQPRLAGVPLPLPQPASGSDAAIREPSEWAMVVAVDVTAAAAHTALVQLATQCRRLSSLHVIALPFVTDAVAVAFAAGRGGRGEPSFLTSAAAAAAGEAAPVSGRMDSGRPPFVEFSIGGDTTTVTGVLKALDAGACSESMDGATVRVSTRQDPEQWVPDSRAFLALHPTVLVEVRQERE